MHLHAKLQKEILPKLLKLFPKVQFIISTHSPLFLLGMDEEYGEDGYEIYQMPTAQKITSERFSEFLKAYDYFAETEKHHERIFQAIQNQDDEPLVITEGATDWKHMKAAFKYLCEQEDYRKDYSSLVFKFLEYEPENSPQNALHKMKMSNSDLCAMCEQVSKLKRKRKLIFIADADDDRTNKKLGMKDCDKKYKSWGNNVFSFVLPVPEIRKCTPGICIEHYYTDDIIKTEVEIDGAPRRLYMGNEFNKFGISFDRKKHCKNINACGEDKITMISGS